MLKILSAAVTLLLALEASAHEQIASLPGIVVNADWKRRPTSSELLTVFPTEAFRRGISGKASIACTVTIQGALNRCTVIGEEPANMGFGAAAIALAPQFLMKPATLNGLPMESAVRIPLNFKVPPGGSEVPVGSKRVLSPNLAWAEAPSYADVAAAYPAKAGVEKIGGRATLSCGMTEEGRLKSCDLATSEPRGYGFDLAAKGLAKRFRLELLSESDRKMASSVVVHLPITFDPAMLGTTPAVIGKPSWAATPGASQLAAVFGGLSIVGTVRVALACSVEQGGHLSGCSVVSEQPLGAQVGQLALGLAPSFRISTWSTEGLPIVGGTIRIPIRYEGTAKPIVPPPPQ